MVHADVMTAVPKPEDTAALIDRWWEQQEEELPCPHLDASLLGHPCGRRLWLSFRWAVLERPSGRIRRLADRDRRETAFMVENLRRAGIEIHSTCPDDGGRRRVELAPHVAGSPDGIIESGVPEAPKSRHVAEFSAHSLEAFTELKRKGVFDAQRRRWCQIQCWMHGTGIRRALCVALCRDNGELYTERVEYHPVAAKDIIGRGAEIALKERIPPALSTDPSRTQCRQCPARPFCPGTRPIEPGCVSCRTCAHVTPGKDGWQCENIPLHAMTPEEQREGCPRHVLHPDLVPWPLMGSDEDGNGIYEIDGVRVVNGKGGVLSRDLLKGRREPRQEADLPF
ncbi:MAG: hypothetical protein K6E38_05205 [Fretibacterium sp.]|nr:hypothetical protein [Fretibacterium sp.]